MLHNFGLGKENLSADHFVDWYNTALATGIALLTALFGRFWYLFAIFLLLNVFDWVTGWRKAHKAKQESSAAGLQGIVKKLWYWVLVAVAFLVGKAFTTLGQDVGGVNLAFLELVGWFTLGSLTVNEVRSVVENLVVLGVKVPSFLQDSLEITQKLLADKGAALLGTAPKIDPPNHPKQK